MAARDLYHDVVRKALEQAGWTITHDPLVITYFTRDVLIDLGAEHNAIAASRAGEKIAVEIKTFRSASAITDLEKALGQYSLYELLLKQLDPSRVVYLAITERTCNGFFAENIGQLVLEQMKLRLIIFDEEQGEIRQWIN